MPFKVIGTPSPHPPHTAPGFYRAWRMGLLPRPQPASPPPLLPGLNSVKGVLLGVALPVVVFLVALNFYTGAEDSRGTAAIPAGLRYGFMALAIIIGVVVLVAMRRFFTRTAAEHAAGYTHLAAQSGLWAINPFTGKAWRAPDPGVLATGWYPSPYFPGVMQLWDGPDWAGLGRAWWHPGRVTQVFRPPASDFLGVGNVDLDDGTEKAPLPN